MIKFKTTIVLLIFFIFFAYSIQADYAPEITGRLETGDRFDEKITTEDDAVFYDSYDYVQYWLRYRQQLAPGEYYSIRGQFKLRENKERINLSNKTLELDGNYTFYLSKKIRNRLKLDLRNRNYFHNQDNSNYNIRFEYQLEYEYSEIHNYSLAIQRAWNKYHKAPFKDNLRDVLSLEWDFAATDNLDLSTNIRLDRQLYQPESESTNKYGRRVSLNFRYRPPTNE